MADSDDTKLAELTQRLADSERRAQAAEARVAELQRALDDTRHRLASYEPVPAPKSEAAPAPEAAPALEAAPEPEAAPAPATDALAAADGAGADAPAPAEPDFAPGPPPPEDPRDPELVARLEVQRRALYKRGFRRGDLYYHVCASCGEQAVEEHSLHGKPGGRDIDLCLHCGAAVSWRRRPEKEGRERDETFDLVTFLR